MARRYTNELYDMLDQGLLSPDTVIKACLSYMSEDEVKDMMEHNDFIISPEDIEEPEDEEIEENED